LQAHHGRDDWRGDVAERRDYDPVTGTYQVTTMLSDHAGRMTESTVPGGITTRNVYDSRGRLARSETLNDAGVVLTMRETTYDNFDRAIEVRLTEVAENGTDTVTSYRQNFYDLSGRLIASANFGTNDAGDVDHPIGNYVSGPAPPQHDGTIPTPSDDVHLTSYIYGPEGQIVETVDPAGRVAATEYDDLGRTVLTTENADGAADMRRWTAMNYDELGRLVEIAAVLPTHSPFAPKVAMSERPVFDDIDWNATDGSI
jgi:YD repeat-containing protein